MRRSIVAIFSAAALSGCAADPEVHQQTNYISAPPQTDPLYRPQRVIPGRLEYAPDRSTFAPVLTQRFTYPTQPQANYAFQRSQWSTVAFQRPTKSAPTDSRIVYGTSQIATSVALFACKPGAIDSQTGRYVSYRGPVVVCATDFLDEGAVLYRAPVNFYNRNHAWHMIEQYPPTVPVPWLNPEPSIPRNWNPFGDKT